MIMRSSTIPAHADHMPIECTTRDARTVGFARRKVTKATEAAKATKATKATNQCTQASACHMCGACVEASSMSSMRTMHAQKMGFNHGPCAKQLWQGAPAREQKTGTDSRGLGPQGASQQQLHSINSFLSISKLMYFGYIIV